MYPRLDFLDDFVGVVATVHRQLPHDPVSVVVVVGVDGGVQTRPAVAVSVGVRPQIEARSPAVQQVLDLLGQIGVRGNGKKEKVSNILLVLIEEEKKEGNVSIYRSCNYARERSFKSRVSKISLAKTERRHVQNHSNSTIRERREEVISTAKDEYISTVRI